jgi:type IV secretion system protein VirB10
MTAASCAAFAQSTEEAAPGPATSAQPQPGAGAAAAPAAAQPVPVAAPAAGAVATGADPATPARKVYVVPAGTKVLLQLRSAVNTKSARPGDGVYLASAFPVVVGNRVMIPSGVYVQGVVDRVERAGHVKGKAQLDMHFTSIIFPNGSVVEVPGRVESLPGAKKQTIKGDEGTIEQDGDKTRNMGKVAAIAIPTGATVGSIGGLESGHGVAGGVAGIGAGLAAMGLATLFTRGADVNIESGTQVEMILQRPLLLEETNLAGVAAPGPAELVPSASQPKPLEKPAHARVMCPPGGLGCE